MCVTPSLENEVAIELYRSPAQDSNVSESEIQEALGTLDGWSAVEGKLPPQFEFFAANPGKREANRLGMCNFRGLASLWQPNCPDERSTASLRPYQLCKQSFEHGLHPPS